jgi:hypothetical protein
VAVVAVIKIVFVILVLSGEIVLVLRAILPPSETGLLRGGTVTYKIFSQ